MAMKMTGYNALAINRRYPPPDIPDHLISRLSEFVNSKTGLYFPETRWRNLKRGISAAARDFSREYGIDDDPSVCIRWLLSSPPTKEQMDILTAHLTIGETYFFREESLFQVLEDIILPQFIRSRREKGKTIRLWSAGCCTGEEPYSLSILIDLMIPKWEEWEITILATDINARFLQKAEKGVYTNWSFRNTPEWIKKRYFKTGDKNCLEILPRLKKMIRFEQFSLAEETCFDHAQSMDMILCRNVLMYFMPELRSRVIARFSASLSEGGWLIVSPGETAFVQHSDLSFVRFPEVILYQKKYSK
jgi:chemotaxis protein methyltransferase CheR